MTSNERQSDEREVVIDGVNKQQMKLLDTMWGIDSSEDYMAWRDALPAGVKKEVELLEQLLLLADIDMLADDDLSQAKSLLAKY